MTALTHVTSLEDEPRRRGGAELFFGTQLQIDERLSHAVDAHAFLPSSLSGNDRHGTPGNADGISKDFDQFSVGGTVHGRSIESNQQRVTSHAGET